MLRSPLLCICQNPLSRSNSVTYLAGPIILMQSSIPRMGKVSTEFTLWLSVHMQNVSSGFGTRIHGKLNLL